MIFLDDESSEIKFHIGEDVDIDTSSVSKLIKLSQKLS